MAQTEGAKFWLSVMTELKNRGLQDIFVACCDGLKGFPEAIEAVYPQTRVQLCIVHQVRHSLRYVSWKQRKEVARITSYNVCYTKLLRTMLPEALSDELCSLKPGEDRPALVA